MIPNDPNDPAGRRSKSLRFRLMGILAIVPVIFGVAMLVGIFYVYQNRIIAEYAESAVNIAKMIASQISGEDVDRYYETLEEDEQYEQLLNLMRLTARGTGAEYIYISKYVEGGEIFLFDADEDEEDKFELGDFEDWSADDYDLDILARLLRGERVDPYTVGTRWGWLMTTHEPIERADGSVAGYANVDLSMDMIRRERKIAFAMVGLIVVVAFSASIFFNLYIIQKYVISPIRKLVTGVSLYRPGANAPEQPKADAGAIMLHGDDRNDEIGDLARKIEDMVGDISQRDSQLIAANLQMQNHSAALETALKSAQAASRAKSDFLSNMSHEIRTPMNAIIGMTNIAKSSYSTDRKDYALGRISEASNHLLGIINDILDMSKIEADKFELHPEPFVFEELLKKVINIINFRVVEKHQKLAVYIDENIPRRLICDDQRLAQVITNLLSNAVKFTPENGTISLSAELLSEEDDVCEIRFDVVDTGVGIDDEQQTRLFKPFEQAESSTTRKFGGTGLGLTISKRIVELMSGSISVVSALGEGATFTFTIICKKPGEEADDGLMAAGNVKVDDLRVLVVDDDDDIRDYFIDVAKRFHIRCDTAASGEQALELLESNDDIYDICFVDWKMPGMDGIELTRRIRNINEDETVIIMISSVEWQDIAEEAKGAGIDKFLAKPIFPSAFIECINAAFGIDLLNGGEHDKSDKVDSFWGYRVLLVEDVDINREIVIALLEPTLLEIDCAENGVEAVRMFNEDPDKYNIVFMDLQMPEMDGFEATRVIRASDSEWAKSVPVIAMTANVFKEDVEHCLEAGMNDHLGKPLDFDDVLRILRHYLFNQKPVKERRKEDRRKGNSDRRQMEDRRKGDRRG